MYILLVVYEALKTKITKYTVHLKKQKIESCFIGYISFFLLR